MPFPLLTHIRIYTRRFSLYPGDPHLILESWQRWYLKCQYDQILDISNFLHFHTQ